MTCTVVKGKDCVAIVCRRGKEKSDVLQEKMTPRFRYCEEIKCPDRYNCKEKLEVRAARDIGAYGLDYYCQKQNKIVYKD